MKYFHCPKEYRAKAYGCGFGPVNGTVAFLDLGSTCPRCKKELKPHSKKAAQREYEVARRQQGIDTVRELFGDEAATNYATTKPEIK